MQQKYLMDLQLGSVLTVPSKDFESHSVGPHPHPVWLFDE